MATLTTVVSVSAACLDEALLAETAFFPKCLNACLDAHLSNNEDGDSPTDRKRRLKSRLWRNVLERLIIALADQQLVTGFAILVTGWIVYWGHFGSAHFTLVLYLSFLSSSSHLAAIITLRQYFGDHPGLAKLRLFCTWIFAGLLLVQSRPLALFPFLRLAMPWIFWTATWHLITIEDREVHKANYKTIKRLASRSICWILRYNPSAKAKDRWKRHTVYPRKVLHYLAFLTPFSVFVLQIFFASFGVALVLAQKFTPGGPDSNVCSLRSDEENEMGYGQILAILLLILPIIAAYEAYKGKCSHGDRQSLAWADKFVESPKIQALSLPAPPADTPPTSDEQVSEDQEFTSPQRQDTEQRIGTPSLPPASSSATSLATFVSAVDQQPPQAQASLQRQDTQQTVPITRLPDLAVTSARQPEIEVNVLRRKNTI